MQDPVVTTSRHPEAALEAFAKDIAARTGLVYVRRTGHVDPPALVIERGAAYLLSDDRVTKSHPGMGLVRVRRIRRGEIDDPLLAVGAIQPTDHVLDCTFGFGQDALVLASRASEGRIVGLESSPALCALALAGMQHWDPAAAKIVPRIELLMADYREYLKAAPDRAFDVVFIDPMFRRPKAAAPDFVTLRAFANDAPLEADTLQEARRVARRLVVVKDAWPGPELERLGLTGQPERHVKDILFGTATAY